MCFVTYQILQLLQLTVPELNTLYKFGKTFVKNSNLTRSSGLTILLVNIIFQRNFDGKIPSVMESILS